MAIDIKHPFVSAKTDSPDSTRVQPSNWNAGHTLTLGAAKVLGRDASAAGAAQELPLAFDVTLQSMVPPTGTTAQRPAAPVAGMLRYNSTIPQMEIYVGGAWVALEALGAALKSIASLTTAADKMIYTTAANTYATADLSPFARTLLDDLTAAAALTTLGAQPSDADLAAVAALATTGLAVRTAADTWALRTITSTNSSITVTNPGGVAGNINLAMRGFECRAWVNFNGTGTVAIRADGNVSSITDNGIGDYTVNFTTAMVDANYAAVATCQGAGVTSDIFISCGNAGASIYSTTQCRIVASLSNAVVADPTIVSFTVIR